MSSRTRSSRFSRLRSRLVLVSIASAIVGGSLTALGPQQAGPEGDFYYAGAERVSLERSTSESVVRFTGRDAAAVRQTVRAVVPGATVGEPIQLEGQGYQVVSEATVGPRKGEAAPSIEAAEAQRGQLRQQAGVDFVAPVFYYPRTGARMLPTDEVVVKLGPGTTEADLPAIAAGFGLTVSRKLWKSQDEFVLRLASPLGGDTLERSRALYESGRFRYAQPDFIQQYEKFDTPDDPRFGQQWHLHNTGQSGGVVDADVDAPEAWDLQTGSSSIVIAVIDDGVEKTHEDLSAAIFANPGETPGNGIDDDGNLLVDDVNGWDFSNNDNDASPALAEDNHGTAVAGVAAARGNNATGVTGACRNCRILPVKIFTGASYAGDVAVASAIRYASTFADVLNNSWGGGAPSAILQSAISDAITTGRGGKGSVVLFASGNSASGAGTYTITGFPAGTYTFRWEYEKDSTSASGDDTAWLGWVAFPGGTIVNFEGGVLPAGFTTGGTAGGGGWGVVNDPIHSDEGACFTRAAKPAVIGNSQTSWLQTTRAVGAGSMVSWRWVSSELGWDGLKIKLDFNNDGTFDQILALQSGVPAVATGVSYPAANPEAIAVGASSNFDCRSYYSQVGPQLAFVAPSSAGAFNLGIETTDRTGAAGYESTGNYTLAAGASGFGGTSSATPLASGIAGLILSRNPTLTRAQVLSIMQGAADKVGPQAYVSGRNDRYGYGRLNAYQALLNTPLPSGAPGAFGKIAPANGATGVSTAPTLSWAASSGATSYEYCYDATNDNACTTWTAAGTNTSAAIGGLANSTTYYWHARAINGNGTTYGNGAATTFWSFTTQAPGPAAFGKVTPANSATGVVISPTLSWGASSGSTSYEYCYDTTNDNACAAWTGVGTSTSAALAGLATTTTYYWHVRANNGSGTTYADGGATAFWSFTTGSAPGAFNKSAPTNGATSVSTSPFLSWASSSGATSYEYCYDTTNDNACAAWTSTGTSTSATPSGLSASTIYYWQVRANNANGTTYANGGATVFWSFTTAANLPGAFGKSFPGNGATGIVANPFVSWGSSSLATGYEYCYDTSNDNACTSNVWTSTGTSTSTTFTGLSGSTTYYWQVRANNANGTTYADGGPTVFWSFTTAVVVPPTPCNVLSLNGASGYASAAGTVFPNSTTMSSFTAEAWVYPGSIPLDHNFQVIAMDDAWDLAVLWNPGVINQLVVRLRGNGGTVTETYFDPRFVVTNQWHHVALVYDNTTRQLRIALDGALGAPLAVGITSWSTYTNTLTVGNLEGANFYFNGLVDNLRVSDLARYSSNFTPATTLVTDANTRALYQFGATVGATSFADESGNGNTLTGFGGAQTAAAGGCTPQAGAPTVASITPNSGPTTGGTLVGIAGTGFVNGATVSIGGVAAGVTFNSATSITATTGARAAGTVNVVVTNPDTLAGTLTNGFTYFVPLPGTFGKTAPANGATGVSTSPTLSWAASAGAASYEYCYDTTNDSACAAWTSAGASTSVGLSGLTGNTTYYWHVRASNAGGTTYADGAATAFWSFTTQVAAPGAFTKTLPVVCSSPTSCTLAWTPSVGATSYEYCLDTSNDNACAAWTNTGASTGAVVSPLSPGVTYYWQVRANSVGGTTYANGAATAFSGFTTPVAPPGPFAKTAPANGATAVSVSPTLSWGASAGAASYEYCYDTTNDSACAAWTSAGASTSVGLSGLTGNTTYYWHVRASNAGGTTYADGASTAFWNFTTQAGPPGAFGKTTPANGASGLSTTPTLSWSAAGGATGYEYCYDARNDNACSTWTSVGAATSVGLSGLAPGTSYYWHVRATNGLGTTYADGGALAFWSFGTQQQLPGAFGKTTPANGATGVSTSPTLSWSAATNGPSYEYCYDTTNDNACAVWTSVGSATSAALSGLLPSTAYSWHVRATNAAGTTFADGSGTAFWSFTTAVATGPGAFGKTAPADGATNVPTSPTLTWGASSGATSYEYCADARNDNACEAWTSAGASLSAALSNLSAGTSYFWQVRATNGGAPTPADGAATAFWRFTTAGSSLKADFNGDGLSDLLVTDAAGTLTVWLMDGATPIGSAVLSQSPLDPAWAVVGVRDFTGDGKPDVLVQQRTTGALMVQIMDGVTRVADQAIPVEPNTPWRVVATGDLNADGAADLVWAHPAEGRFAVWFMRPANGRAGFGGPDGVWAGEEVRDTRGLPLALGPTSLGVVGTGDIDGDGQTDLVLQDAATSEVRIWTLRGTTVVAETALVQAGPWQVRAIGDYNGDDRPDILWQRVSDGALYYWQLRGTTLTREGAVAGLIDATAVVVGPR